MLQHIKQPFSFVVEVSGRFWWRIEGFSTKIACPFFDTVNARWLETANFAVSLLPAPSSLSSTVIFMAVFNSSVVITDAQLVDAPQLEPAFERMLRNSSVHESVISILRANSIVDRDTFVNMYDSESSLKEGAGDLGFDVATGGLPHKREFARIVTAWKTAKVMAETKLQTDALQTDAVARAHGVPVTLLPCDWTSIMTEFKNKFGNHISDDRLPAQSMFESFTEKLADGTLKAEPLSLVVSLFEEEQHDAQKTGPFPVNTIFS